jgi:hypothetical protein
MRLAPRPARVDFGRLLWLQSELVHHPCLPTHVAGEQTRDEESEAHRQEPKDPYVALPSE